MSLGIKGLRKLRRIGERSHRRRKNVKKNFQNLFIFPDVVSLFMQEHHDLPIRMQGEDLRLELRDAGMLENGEMIYALPKALDDYRFAWSNENKTVFVRGNK